jgi:predicted RNA binding protein YcfA (HicA-like mRNA interferase family)
MRLMAIDDSLEVRHRAALSGWGCLVSGAREAHRLVRTLRQAGWIVRRTGGGHWRAESADGRRTTIAGSPSHAGLVRDRCRPTTSENIHRSFRWKSRL